MEGFISDLKKHYFVDSSNKEVVDMQSAVETVLTSYKRVNNIKRDVFRIEKFEMIGGMAEQTKLWSFGYTHDAAYADQNVSEKVPVIRFDFLAVLYRDVSVDKSANETCNGFLQIFQATQNGNYDAEYEKHGVYLSPVEVARKFENELVSSIVSICDCHSVVQRNDGLSLRRKKRKGRSRCQKCITNMESGYLTIASETEYGHPQRKQSNFVFKWTSTARSLFIKDIEGKTSESFQADHIFIQVDITPAYSLHDEEHQLSRLGARRLIPKPCKNCDNSKCWKISYTTKETEMIQKTSDLHKQVLMVLKTVVSLSFPKSAYGYLTMPAEVLKAAFLQYAATYSETDADIIECLTDILSMLSDAFENRELINPASESNALERYGHLRDDFFTERSACFRIIQHIVSLAELIGETHCRVDIIQPLLENTPTIHKALTRRNMTLDDYLISLNTSRSQITEPTVRSGRGRRNESHDAIYGRPRDGSENHELDDDDTASITSSLLFRNLLFARRWYPRMGARATENTGNEVEPANPKREPNVKSNRPALGPTLDATSRKRKRLQKDAYKSVASYACSIQ